jgi:hypothetical protein
LWLEKNKLTMTEPEELYRVVFAGNLTGDFPLDKTKLRFGKVFRLAPNKVERIFNGHEITLKTNMPETKAMDFAVKLAEVGCETYIELVPDEEAKGPNFKEQRKKIRRISYRRAPRPGAIVPDRRILASRRKADLISLEQNGDFPGNSVGPEDS